MSRYFQIFSLALLLPFSLSAQVWVRGSAIVHSVDGKAEFTELGSGTYHSDLENVPSGIGGLFNCLMVDSSSAFFSTSNRMFIQHNGPGSFSIERFEQVEPHPETWQEDQGELVQSRMIYNLRSGGLMVDARRMLETSQCSVEIPLGRVSLRRALIGLKVELGQRGEIFSFEIVCLDGQVRFTDNRGGIYTLRTGQRLAGVGGRMAPSIEVGALTAQWSERSKKFKEKFETYRQPANVLAAYQPRFLVIDRVGYTLQTEQRDKDSSTSRRPIVIERASDPDPVTPFRGEVSPPSAYRADIF